ncbi:MAG: hypothetical protein Q9219_002513 [cf. Caloplaca sp. 3 TL-2023]
MSLFILYWNIFKPFRWLKFGITIGGFVVTAVYVGFILTFLIEATPRPGEDWLVAYDCKICENKQVPLAAWGLATDIYLLLLPISGVLQLALPPRRKIWLVAVFMTGLGPDPSISSKFKKLFTTLYIFHSKHASTGTTYPENNQASKISGPYQSLPDRRQKAREEDDCELALRTRPSITTDVTSQPTTDRSLEGIQLKVELMQHESMISSTDSIAGKAGTD